MRFWILTLTVFGYAWVTAGGLLMVVGIGGVWFHEGFYRVQWLLSPFNPLNLLVFAPGIAAVLWAERLKQRRQSREEG